VQDPERSYVPAMPSFVRALRRRGCFEEAPNTHLQRGTALPFLFLSTIKPQAFPLADVQLPQATKQRQPALRPSMYNMYRRPLECGSWMFLWTKHDRYHCFDVWTCRFRLLWWCLTECGRGETRRRQCQCQKPRNPGNPRKKPPQRLALNPKPSGRDVRFCETASDSKSCDGEDTRQRFVQKRYTATRREGKLDRTGYIRGSHRSLASWKMYQNNVRQTQLDRATPRTDSPDQGRVRENIRRMHGPSALLT
jgi:hypothetical protein